MTLTEVYKEYESSNGFKREILGTYYKSHGGKREVEATGLVYWVMSTISSESKFVEKSSKMNNSVYQDMVVKELEDIFRYLGYLMTNKIGSNKIFKFKVSKIQESIVYSVSYHDNCVADGVFGCSSVKSVQEFNQIINKIIIEVYSHIGDLFNIRYKDISGYLPYIRDLMSYKRDFKLDGMRIPFVI